VEVGAAGEGGARNAASGSGKSGGSGDAECSAAGLDLPEPNLSYLPEPVQETATAMRDAALACDDEALIALADTSRDEANWGNHTPRELLELPGAEKDADVYAILARLLSTTRGCLAEGGIVTEDGSSPWSAVSWPVVSGEGPCAEYPSDWEAVVASGAVSADEAAEMSAEGSAGYTGWRFTIEGDGTWGQLVTGSWADIAAGG